VLGAHRARAKVATARTLAVGKAAAVLPGGQLRGQLMVIDNSDVVGPRSGYPGRAARRSRHRLRA
jgi:hypothetical protein